MGEEQEPELLATNVPVTIGIETVKRDYSMQT